MKKCSKCGQEKPIEDFYPNRRAKDGHSWYCKECDKAAARVSRAKNCGERTRYGKKRVFGVRKHTRHVHTHADYMHGVCLKCRTLKRWEAFSFAG